MNIFDLLICKARKIDSSQKFEIAERISKLYWKEYVKKIADNGEYVIILDENGLYKDEIKSKDGLYVEIDKVGVSYISIDYPERIEVENINMEDFYVIGIGFKNNYARNSLRKQSLALGLSLGDFFMVDSKTVSINKYVLISNAQILNHLGLLTKMKIMKNRNFRFILVEDI